MTPRRAFVCALAGALALGSPPAVAAAGWNDLRRPLHLPRLAAGAPCPISPAVPGAARRGLTPYGRGPVHPSAVGGAPAGRVHMHLSLPDSAGLRGQKSPWLIEPRGAVPTLVRIRRLSPGAGRVLMGAVPQERATELRLRLDRAPQARASGWRGLPGNVWVERPGCYAFQIDGPRFSTVAVFRVTF